MGMRSIAAVLLALVMSGAAALPAQAADKLKVLTTFTVIADIAANVAGDAAEVVSITKPGADIHTYSPTPGDIRRALGAGLVLRNGLNLELWFEKFLRNLGEVPAATVSDGISPIGITEGPYEGKPNPHAWMSPEAAKIYVANIRDALSAADPGHAATYAANAAAYTARIDAVAAPIRERLAALPPDRRWLVTSEGAFSYLARDFGLKEAWIWPINADGQGTPQQVRRVIDTVREHQIPVVFSESTVSPDPARQVARETGARYGGVLYVDTLTDADGPVPTYLDLLRVTAGRIADELSRP
ncbi:iron ABC transporter substrate binding protein [Tistrella mobilis KA081020-065]|uniref:Iron ABC transporter substrate binding protein n=2 Tax=Tistrella mobilis TaxID=171437 RepID=I3TP84_TISMK|nr:iron ABC transporter substrate binding protein [Tistrella mobilis KA081020-065]